MDQAEAKYWSDVRVIEGGSTGTGDRKPISEEDLTSAKVMGVSEENFQRYFREKAKKFMPLESFSINWIEKEGLNTWKKVKAYTIGCFKKGESLMMVAHSKDVIIGKPQLITDVKQTIPLVIVMEKEEKETTKTSYKFIDDRVDKRYDGYEKESYEESFYIYRVIYNNYIYRIYLFDLTTSLAVPH